MPPSDSPSETITLRGPAEALGTGMNLTQTRSCHQIRGLFMKAVKVQYLILVSFQP
jgi:hypothetical protein